MAGNTSGGLKAAITNKTKYGSGFYAKIGAMGGMKSRGGGFAAKVPCNCNIFHYKHYISNCAGKKGGKISKRTKSV